MKVAILAALLAALLIPAILMRFSARAARSMRLLLTTGIFQFCLGVLMIAVQLGHARHAWTFGAVCVGVGLLNIAKAKRLRNVNLTDFSNATHQDPEISLPPRGRAYLTLSLIALLTGIFVLEQMLSVTPMEGLFKIGTPSLIGMGALNRALVVDGQWYRLVTTIFLHGDGAHIFFNGITLWFVGWLLENRIGRAWFAAVFFIGGVCGSVASLLLNPAAMTSVGASGAITALLSAAFVVSFRLPNARERTSMQVVLMRLLIPAIAPIFFHNDAAPGTRVDYAAHLGGGIAGVILGTIIVRAWPRNSTTPEGRRFALAAALTGGLALLIGVVPVAARYLSLDPNIELVATKDLPKTDALERGQFISLIKLYPHDPRARLLYSLALIRTKDFAGAEREARAGLAERRILANFFPPELSTALAAALGASRLGGGHLDQAVAELSQALQARPSSALFAMRAEALLQMDHWNEARDDLIVAIRGDKSNVGLHVELGIVSFVTGDVAAAATNLAEGKKAESTRDYAPLWVYLAQTREGVSDLAVLQQAKTQMQPDKWPSPILALYLSEISEQQLMALANTGDDNTRRGQVCEAIFYIGEHKMLEANGEKGREMLREAAQICPDDFIERKWARGEVVNFVHE